MVSVIERGEYSERRMLCEVSGDDTSVYSSKRESAPVPKHGSIDLELRNIDARPRSITTNDQEASWHYKQVERKFVFSLPESAGEVAVKVRF